MVVRITEHRIRADSTDDVAVLIVERGRIGALVVERIVRDEIRVLERGSMLNVLDAGVRVANGVVETLIVGEPDHVVVQRAYDFQTVANLTNKFAAAEQAALFAGKRYEDDG